MDADEALVGLSSRWSGRVARAGRLRRDRGVWFVAILGAAVVAYVAWTWGHWWGDPTVVSDVAPIPVAALATLFGPSFRAAVSS